MYFWQWSVYSKVASFDQKNPGFGLIHHPLNRPLSFPFLSHSLFISSLFPPSSSLFISVHLSHSLLSFSLPLHRPSCSPSLIPPPSVGSCRCAHVADESICGGSARTHTHMHAHTQHTHTHTYPVSHEGICFSLSLSEMQHQQRREGETNRGREG